MNSIQYAKVSFTNCFLLRCKGGYLMIDTGFPGEYYSFLKKLAKININVFDIKYLLLTHSHNDHSGFAAEIVGNTEAKIIAHKKGVSILENGVMLMNNGKYLNSCTKFITGVHSKLSSRSLNFPSVRFTKNDYIINGDDFELLKKIGIDGKILYTPGHTDDSISVLLSDDSAIVGDVAMNPFYLKICSNRYRPMWLQDIEKVYESWEKLIKHGAKTIYPSHGTPFNVEKLNYPKRGVNNPIPSHYRIEAKGN